MDFNNFGDGGGFDNAGGFGGGGFDNNAGGQHFVQGGGFVQSSQGGDDSKKKNQNQSMTAVTLKQLFEADNTNSKLRVDGAEIPQVTFVALLLGTTVNAANIHYSMSDGTSSEAMDVMQFVDMEDENAQVAQFENGTYVRVFGRFQVMNNKLKVLAFSLRPVTDMNEVTFHLQEVMFTHLQRTKGQLQQPGAAAAAAGGGGGLGGGLAAAAQGGVAGGGMSPDEVAVYQALKALSAGVEGASVFDVAARLGGGMTSERVHELCRSIEEKGAIYTTTDDYHFIPTDPNF